MEAIFLALFLFIVLAAVKPLIGMNSCQSSKDAVCVTDLGRKNSISTPARPDHQPEFGSRFEPD
jgi:hypothetical protein